MGELTSRFIVVLNHDQGRLEVETVASSSTAAAAMVCLAEGAPLSAVEEVRFVELHDHVFTFTVYVTCETREQAEMVMGQRLGYDEEYGFNYFIDYE